MSDLPTYYREQEDIMAPLVLASLIFIAVLNHPTAAAYESVPIAAIVEDPYAYSLTKVTLQGSVREVKNLAPYFFADVFMCYGAYSFILQDRTGSIEVGVRGICGTPAMRFPEIIKREVSDGDRIVVEAEIHPPGDYLGDGFPLFGEVLNSVKAIVSKFVLVGSFD